MEGRARNLPLRLAAGAGNPRGSVTGPEGLASSEALGNETLRVKLWARPVGAQLPEAPRDKAGPTHELGKIGGLNTPVFGFYGWKKQFH